MVYGLVEQYHSAESGAEELRRHVDEVPRPPQPAPGGGGGSIQNIMLSILGVLPRHGGGRIEDIMLPAVGVPFRVCVGGGSASLEERGGVSVSP